METDFDRFWASGSWRKLGKVEAERRFKAQIKTEKAWVEIQAARDVYNFYCFQNKRWYTPMLGSVWFGERKGWRNWIPDQAENNANGHKPDPLPLIHEHLCEFCPADHVWVCDDPEECNYATRVCCPAFTQRVSMKAVAR